MPISIALFRGINVGGNNLIPMKELTAILDSLGFTEIKTYIQSGNVTFKSAKRVSAKTSDLIADEIERCKKFRPAVLLLTESQLKKAMAENPFPDSESDPKSLHLLFLSRKPKNPDLKALDEVKKPSESYRLTDRVFYLHAPEGIGRSKLVVKVESVLGVPATGRNWRTVQKISEMVRES